MAGEIENEEEIGNNNGAGEGKKDLLEIKKNQAQGSVSS
jgi:hypothetical protein